MRRLEVTSQFRKDYKRMRKRGADMAQLESVLDRLLADAPLDNRNRDHQLTGNYAGFRECHIAPDWLLIYRKEDTRLILVANRTGTHADLFDE